MIDEKKLIEDITNVEVAWYLDGNYTTYDSTTIMEIIEEQPKVGEWISVYGYGDEQKIMITVNHLGSKFTKVLFPITDADFGYDSIKTEMGYLYNRTM